MGCNTSKSLTSKQNFAVVPKTSTLKHTDDDDQNLPVEPIHPTNPLTKEIPASNQPNEIEYKPWYCNLGHTMYQVEEIDGTCTRCKSTDISIICQSVDHVKLCSQCFGMTCDGDHNTNKNTDDTTRHRLIQSNQPNQCCTLCQEFDEIETIGTTFSCGSNCDYNICKNCYATLRLSTSRGARGSFINHIMKQKMSQENIVKEEQNIHNKQYQEEKYQEETTNNISMNTLSSREVVEFVSDVDVMFSFASATGGLTLSKYLRERLLQDLPKYLNEKSVYIDCVNLRDRKDTHTTLTTNVETGEKYNKVENPHW